MRVWAFAALIVVIGCAGCGSVVPVEGPDASASTLANGEVCGTGTDCASTHCVDGVCCDTGCTGTCEACNVTGSVGTCSAVPANTDPAMECMPIALPDGGAGDGGTVDGGEQINLPDGGLNAMAGPCAPSCNGQRACGFPDKNVSCGDTFCNSTTESGAAVCDGKGYCDVELTACTAYVCAANACKTQCVSNSDCQDDYYCSTNSVCLPKKTVTAECLASTECQSGFCDNNVCCATDCSLVPSGSCDSNGFVGTCKCTIAGNAACGGVCQYYYADADGDGYGNPASVIG